MRLYGLYLRTAVGMRILGYMLYPDPDTLVGAVCGSGYLGKSCIRLQYADTGCIHASHGRELSIRDESDRSYLIKREMSIRDESDRTY